MRYLSLLLLCALLSFNPEESIADPITTAIDDVSCPDAGILGAGMFTKVCWGAMFPIRVAGADFFSGSSSAPPDANSQALCVCGGDLKRGRLPSFGIALGLWQPTRLIEVVRRPYCFPAMGGVKMAETMTTAGGELQLGTVSHSGMGNDRQRLGFWNFHYYAFPLLAFLELLDAPNCNVAGFSSFDVMFMGEAFPNWYDDELSFLVHVESIAFANPIALAALPVDCAAATIGNPIDRLHWAAGCWGSVYPFTGNMILSSQRVNNASLASVKALSLMARLKVIDKTVGTEALCTTVPMPILKKSQYKMQMMFPVSESQETPSGLNVTTTPPPSVPVDTTNGGTQVSEVDTSILTGSSCAHPIGSSTLRWGDWRTRPGTGEDFVFMLWQWTDCCLNLIGG